MIMLAARDIIELIKKYSGTIVSGGTNHTRKHLLNSTSDHESTVTAGHIYKADSNSLPVDSGLYVDLTETNERLQVKFKGASNTVYNVVLENPNET
jgi:hypothetical protein